MSAFLESDLTRLKNVDNYNKYVVFGFIRESTDNIKDIPQLINYTVLLYSPQKMDSWKIVGNFTDYFHLRRTITKFKRNCWDNCSFGNITVPSTHSYICKWCLHINHGDDLMIGITSFDDKNDEIKLQPGESLWEQDGSSYCYWSRNGTFKLNESGEETWPEYGQCFGANDDVYIELDLEKRTVVFTKNAQRFGIAYKNIKIGKHINYKLAISMFDVNSSITIKSFEIC